MITIYHNPKCSKSREGLCYLEERNIPHQVVKYLEDGLTEATLTDIISKLNIRPIELVRTKEQIWKETYQNQELTDEDVIKALAKHPKLLERPIVINGNKAVIARPLAKIEAIL